MPKVFGREMPLWLIAGATLLTATFAYTQIFPGDDGIKPATKKKVVATKKTADDIYTPEDRKARFAVFTEPVKNSFKPLVAKMGIGGMIPGGIDSRWANNEVGWSYTGYVVVNGQTQGLLENSTTGEGDYVKTGGHWKSCTVSRISPSEINLNTPDGPHTVKLGEASELLNKTGVSPTGGIAPVNPAAGLSGPIGSPVAAIGTPPGGLPGVQDPTQVAPAVDASAQDNSGNGFNRRRNRRGNGG